MNAITFLLKEHEKVRKSFSEINNAAQYKTKKEMFEILCQQLIRHETMEQQIWYPRFANNEKLDETVKHLIFEEKQIEKKIKEFQHVKTQIEWEEKFSKLKKELEHHASEEEQKLFPNVQKILNREELEEIGKEMHEFIYEFHL